MKTRLEEYIDRMVHCDPLRSYHMDDAKAFEDRLAALQVPTLSVCGSEDETSNHKRSFPLVEIIPEVEFHVFSACNHWAQRDQPEPPGRLMVEYLTR